MVNALSRVQPKAPANEEINCIMPALLPAIADDKFPSALREFINSNADLPTIEELAKKSKKLAIAMGMIA